MNLTVIKIEKSIIVIIFSLLLISSFAQIIGVVFDLGLRITTNLLILNTIFSILSIFLYLRLNNFVIQNKIFLIFFIYIYLALILILQNYLYPELYDSTGRSALEYARSYAIGGMLWLTIGFSFGLASLKIKENQILSFLIVFGLILSLSFVDKVGLVIDYASLKDNRADNIDYSHLVIGHFVLILVLSALAFSRKWDTLIFILGLIIFFMVGGRSDVFVFILAFLLYNFLFDNKKMWLSLFLLISIAFIFIFTIGVSFLKDTKFYFIISGEKDDSWQLRKLIFDKNIENLSSQFFIGNPNKIITTDFGVPELYNNIGAYSHNIVSAWQFYGFIFFIFMILFLFFTVVKILHISRAKIKTDVVEKFFILLFLFSAISLLFTKSIIYYPIWLCMGYWLTKFKF
ncbi:hypothetical protein F908_02966 [Acinetobacter sp. NIPH 284]|uniref:hypothetical protein n=1 Tax=Acinetobacter sp. NIPH 284 TaxID=1217704 RepID=UPI0002CD9AF5|nr:hypothetical protein [Acinetobacter sp. NIPH 284]ENW78847.1 hypothetical protein F908_02966 [Acinetobacter sp. NIPH 284]